MTQVKQDFTIYAGDSAAPIFTVKDGSNSPIDLSLATEIEWSTQRDLLTAVVVRKTLVAVPGGITIVGNPLNGQFQVNLTASDTSSLTGYYLHQAKVTDASGNVATVTLGRLLVGRAPVATYSGDPANSPRDQVRLLVGDTGSAPDQPFELADSEIDWRLTDYPDPKLAAAYCCDDIAMRYARKITKSVGTLKINYSDIITNYRNKAKDLREQSAISSVAPYAGGVSKADKFGVVENTDRVRPPFEVNQFDQRGTGQANQTLPDEEFVSAVP